ncbi:MAG: spondin domain-containing protein, partial [Myxococcota bacterium]|nr:spondin domain-containing protein [Myxococcota bacterium]
MTRSLVMTLGLSLILLSNPALAVQLRVTVENTGPDGGVYLTPVWVGFHNGSFDSYDGGSPAAPELEALAEDGNNGPISAAFGAGETLVPTGVAPSGARVQGNLGGAPIAPGASATAKFEVDTTGANPFFSYAAMVLPTNDYFVANGSPVAHDLSGLVNEGDILSFAIGLPGTVNDAGTEVEDFATSAGNGLFPG